MLNSLDGYICVASASHLKEFKALRDDQVASDINFKKVRTSILPSYDFVKKLRISEIMMGKYTGVQKSKVGIKTIKVNLTQNLG